MKCAVSKIMGCFLIWLPVNPNVVSLESVFHQTVDISLIFKFMHLKTLPFGVYKINICFRKVWPLNILDI
jgi:hypothetical protein